MTRRWLALANTVALAAWGLSWYVPLSVALPQGEAMPNQWGVFVLTMQAHPWEVIVPLVLCFDVALLTRFLKSP